MCKHDPMYQQMNSANGGVGCPRCFKEIQERHSTQLAELQTALQLTPDEQATIKQIPVSFWTSKNNNNDPLSVFVTAWTRARYYSALASRDDYRISGAIEACQYAVERLAEWRQTREAVMP